MLRPASAIIAESWRLYTRHWKHLLPFMVLLFLPRPILTVLGVLGLVLDEAQPTLAVFNDLVVLLVWVGGALLSFWVLLAIFKEGTILSGEGVPTPWKQALVSALPLVPAGLLVTALLVVLLGVGGLLLIVPGVIFFIWFFFTLYELVTRGQRGWNALLASKQLVQGRFWHVAWRLAVPGLFFLILAYLARLFLFKLATLTAVHLITLTVINNHIVALVGSLATPLLIIAGAVLYHDVRAEAPAPSSVEAVA